MPDLDMLHTGSIRHLCHRSFLILTVAAAMALTSIATPAASAASPDQASLFDTQPLDADPITPGDWSVQVGVAFITESRIGDMVLGEFNSADDDAAGQLYSIGVNWTAYRMEIPLGEHIFTPQFEPYARLTLADERGSSLFPDYNAGAGVRWVDFPWNKWVQTSFFMGVGLSYSSQIFVVDRQKHPGMDRSHLKFDWPIQLTLALPRWPQHQLLIFNDHQSGGHIFDVGGMNSVGIGYQFQF